MQPLEAEAKGLRGQLSKVDSKLRLLIKEADDIEKALLAFGNLRERAGGAELTIKEAVLHVLREAPEGKTSGQLLAEMNSRFFNGELRRTSMSPQLARLWHKDKKITYRGGRYFLA
jgi:hypothetical protein